MRVVLQVAALVVLASCGAASSPSFSSTQRLASTPASQPEIVASAPADAGSEPAPAVTASCGPIRVLPPPTDLVAAYQQARALDAAGQLVEAADLFEAIVRADPRHELAHSAVDLSLDALNRAGIDGARPACVARIGALAVDYRALFGCTAPAASSEEICTRLEQLRCDAIRIEGESLADRGEDAHASEVFESAYLTHCPMRSDESLYNAALLARRAGDSPRADRLVAELRRAYPDSAVLRAPAP